LKPLLRLAGSPLHQFRSFLARRSRAVIETLSWKSRAKLPTRARVSLTDRAGSVSPLRPDRWRPDRQHLDDAIIVCAVGERAGDRAMTRDMNATRRRGRALSFSRAVFDPDENPENRRGVSRTDGMTNERTSPNLASGPADRALAGQWVKLRDNHRAITEPVAGLADDRRGFSARRSPTTAGKARGKNNEENTRRIDRDALRHAGRKKREDERRSVELRYRDNSNVISFVSP